MKKWIKITIIVIVSIIVLGVGTCVGLHFYGLHQNKVDNPEEVKSEELIKIEELHQLVYDSLPSETKENVVFKNSFEGYEDLTIVYNTNESPYLNNEGVVSRDEENHVVVVKYVISYKEESKEFGKNITVLKTSGSDSMTNIVAIIKGDIPKRMDNGFILPTTVSKYKGATITWKEEVVNQSTGLVEPTIKVKKVDSQYIVEFSESAEEQICFLEAAIEYQGSTLEQRFVVYTKTSL